MDSDQLKMMCILKYGSLTNMFNVWVKEQDDFPDEELPLVIEYAMEHFY